MQRRPSETDVLIVGAGPTGLLAALELAARGLTLRVIDKSPQRSGESRAMTVQSRSLEILERFGIAEELVANGRKATRIEVVVTGAPAVAIDLSDVGANDSPYPFGLIVSQAETERCMESRLEAWGVHVERQVELLTCLDGGDGAVAMLKHPDGSQESLRAEYVIGCDGVRSAVRHAAGIGLAGTAFEQDFVIADLDVVWREAGEPSAIRLVFPRSGILAIFPFRDAPLCRIVAAGPNLLPEGGEPTIAQIRAIFERFCPARAELKRPRWTTRYRLHHCVAARYRRGRLFLAGDAAHVQSPAGGQGMNTGLLDAANLAWKVALVVRGVSPETLLDSYEEERRPIGQKLRHFTDRLLSVAAAPSVALSALRNLLVMTALPRIAANPRVRRRLFRFVSQLGVRYTGSSIVSEDLAFADASFLRGPGKGARAPDGPLELPGRGTARLFSRLRGPGHHLLVFLGESAVSPVAGASLRRRLPAEVAEICRVVVIADRATAGGGLDSDVLVDASGVVRARYGIRKSGLYLVRPDGYIAYRTPRIDVEGLVAFMRRTVVRHAPVELAARARGAPSPLR